MDAVNEAQEKMNLILSSSNNSIDEETKDSIETIYYQFRLKELGHKKELKEFEKQLDLFFEKAQLATTKKLVKAKATVAQATQAVAKESDDVEVGTVEEGVYEMEE